MKSAVMKRNRSATAPFLPYPNAATRRELLEKYLDRVLMIASCIGITVMIAFFILLA